MTRNCLNHERHRNAQPRPVGLRADAGDGAVIQRSVDGDLGNRHAKSQLAHRGFGVGDVVEAVKSARDLSRAPLSVCVHRYTACIRADGAGSRQITTAFAYIEACHMNRCQQVHRRQAEAGARHARRREQARQGQCQGVAKDHGARTESKQVCGGAKMPAFRFNGRLY